ncbi:MAG: MmcQ/YjbR family DNA-binding protein [Candidatus Saccharimonadales bacterium]
MTEKEIKEYLINFENAWIDKSIDDNLSVFKIGEKNDENAKIFAVVYDNSNPVQISLKCDELLAQELRKDYETVLPSKHLNKRYWNTIICSGQLDDEYIKSLITLSYNLVTTE